MAVISRKELEEQGLEYMTAAQLSLKTGRSTEQINSMTLQIYKSTGETKLDVCYPYPNSNKKGDAESGPRFIVLNDKARNFIEKCRVKATPTEVKGGK